ncbi:E3 ubiquitin-protein ligase XIAP isoform X1 [Brienomyrus brachyistius]|uniref:E3 ubiquitin-protein ligase XIAP isoform X1 n=2 Tax=Brienomyrus brachyistius TaxID=42636 RepID=UPI0020B1C44F|nr:E3 ubiquitin-protein ligase XIAP isoform X1 [Brienomyrus brachyistius]
MSPQQGSQLWSADRRELFNWKRVCTHMHSHVFIPHSFPKMADRGYDSDLEADNGTDWSELVTRQQSFNHFPSIPQVPVDQLARAGFYFTGKADRVRCFSCQQMVEGWHSGDAPVARHQQVSPDCKFLSCVHGLRLASGACPTSLISGGYDEESEDMLFRLRRGEVVDESQYPMVRDMCSEDARLRSFVGWPSSAPVTARVLAQAGFYYLGERDRVQCFCCGGMLADWDDGDDPWTEHEKYYSNCFFILGHDVGNVPSQHPPERVQEQQRLSNETFEGRHQSFQGVQHPVDTILLARAGFYRSGPPDRVMCFKCGGGLKNWQPDEDPWEEHAKHYPGCSFLLSEKGQEFVNSVQLGNTRRSSQNTSHANGFSRLETGQNVMQFKIAQQAVEMGLDPKKVESTILEKMRSTGEEYTKVELLVEDVLKSSAEGSVEEPQANSDEDPLEKLRKLQREKQCKVCMDSDISVVFTPCGHLVTCSNCSKSLSKCPICCAVITQKIKTYIS